MGEVGGVCVPLLVDGMVELLGVVDLCPRLDFVCMVDVVPAPGEVGMVLGGVVAPGVIVPGVVVPGPIVPGELAIGPLGVIEPGAVVALPGGVICCPAVAPGEAAAAPVGPVAPPARGAVPVWAKAGAVRARAATAASMAVFMSL